MRASKNYNNLFLSLLFLSLLFAYLLVNYHNFTKEFTSKDQQKYALEENWSPFKYFDQIKHFYSHLIAFRLTNARSELILIELPEIA